VLGFTPGWVSATRISYDMKLFCRNAQDCNDPFFGTSLSNPSQPISILRFSIDETNILSTTGVTEFTGRILDYKPFTIGDHTFSNQDFVGVVLSYHKRGTKIETVNGPIAGVAQLFSIDTTSPVAFDFYSYLTDMPNVPGGRFWALRRRDALPDGGSIQRTIEGRYQITPVPEPATMLLFVTGIIGLVGSRLKRKKK